MAPPWGSATDPGGRAGSNPWNPTNTGGGNPGGVTPPTQTESPQNTAPGPGGANPWNPAGGEGPQNFGQPMNPWDMPYQGTFTAPMNPWENKAMEGYGSFVQGGQGMGGATNYLNDVLSGKYLNLDSNPWLKQIQSGMQGMKGYQDEDAIRRIQSSMAAGGNAMSGANAGAQSDYMGKSNSAFEALMGQLMNQNYGMERGFMDRAPGELGQIAGQQGAGYGQLFNMGGVGRNIQQNDLNRQYEDFIRQTGNMRDDYRYPDTLTGQLLYGGGYHGQTPNQYGNSPMDIIGGAAGGIDWQSLYDTLFGGGGGGSTNTEVPADTGVQFDGVPLGYDASSVAGPVGYGDTDWYNKALTAAQAKSAADREKVLHPPTNTGASVAAMILQMLKQGSKRGAGGGGGSRGGPGGGSLFDQIKGLFSKNPYPAGSRANQEWAQNFTAGGAPRTPGMEAPYYSGDGSDNMPGPIGYTPENPLSGGGTGSFADIYNNMPPLDDGGYTFNNADNGPNIGEFDPNFDFGGVNDFGGDFSGGGGGGDAGYDPWS